MADKIRIQRASLSAASSLRKLDVYSWAGVFFCWLGFLCLMGHVKAPRMASFFHRIDLLPAIPDRVVPFGLALIATGIGFIVASAPWRGLPWRITDQIVAQPERCNSNGERQVGRRWRAFTLAMTAYACVLAWLLMAPYTHAMVVPFVMALSGFAWVFRSESSVVEGRFSIRWLDIGVLVAVLLLTVIRYWGDIPSWYFSFWGDERAFYEMGKALVGGPQPSIFLYTGVYGKFPLLDSYVVSLFLALFGVSIFSWKLGSVVILGVTCGAVYLSGAVIFNRRVGVIAALLLAVSHYAGAFALIGYNNLHMCLTSTIVVVLFSVSYRNRSPLLAYATGVVGGLMSYSIWGGLIIVPIVCLQALYLGGMRGGRKEVEASSRFIGFGFLLAAVPGLISNPVSSINAVANGLSHGRGLFGDLTVEGTPWNSWTSLTTSIVAFFRNDWWGSHYVFGPLLDPVTGFLVILGFGVLLGCRRSWGGGLLLAWLVIGFVAIIGLSRLNHPYLTRLLFLLPPLALVGGVGAVWLLEKTVWRSGRVIVSAAIGAAIFVLNFQQLYIRSPLNGSLNHVRAMVREIQFDEAKHFIVVTPGVNADEFTCRILSDYTPPGRAVSCIEGTGLRKAIQSRQGEIQDLRETAILAFTEQTGLLAEVSRDFFEATPVMSIHSELGGPALLSVNGRVSRAALAEIRPLPDWLRMLVGVL